MVIPTYDNRQDEYCVLRNFNRYISNQHNNSKKNETPMLEVSNCLDIIYGFCWDSAVNVSVSILITSGQRSLAISISPLIT